MKYGLPYISGYKPMFNYQHLLEDAVLDHVEREPRLGSLFLAFASQQLPAIRPD
ncbi:MAG: hypothetical protein IPH04_02730 [Saprospirales bacterium]|nr:hypothetical protein [Saprospirales bacterium]